MRQKQTVRITNQQRARHNLRALKASRTLRMSAQAKARQLSRTRKLEHGRWWKLIYKFNQRRYKGIAENIAGGFSTPNAVTAAWYKSKTHKANILGEFSHIGIGYSNGYWVQHFGKK